MNWDIVENNWNQLKGKVRTGWRKTPAQRVEPRTDQGVDLEAEESEVFGITTAKEAEKRVKRFEIRNRDCRSQKPS